MNGHLRRCRRARFAKRKEETIDRAMESRKTLSGAPCWLGLRGSFDVGHSDSLRFRLRLATYLQEERCRKSPKGASGAFLDGLNKPDLRMHP
jgi:hypothetical protein